MTVLSVSCGLEPSLTPLRSSPSQFPLLPLPWGRGAQHGVGRQLGPGLGEEGGDGSAGAFIQHSVPHLQGTALPCGKSAALSEAGGRRE